MCTLTFMPQSEGGFIITSNRDEAPGRETLMPEVYEQDGSRLLFPKDQLAGGTWIGLSDKNRFISLMNGGFTAHERLPEYRMSRGVIVTKLLAANSLLESIENFDFHGIEPFTIIAADWNKELRIFELVWDGKDPHLSEKPLAPAIWSSSLLYSEEMKKKREQWFANFLFEHIHPSAEQLLHFHRTAGEGDPKTNLIMDRGFVKTKSITQIVSNDGVEMFYEDLQKEKKSKYSL
jgi:hypothetical protein